MMGHFVIAEGTFGGGVFADYLGFADAGIATH